MALQWLPAGAPGLSGHPSSAFAFACDIAWDNLKTSARATVLIQGSSHHLSPSNMSFVTL